MSREIITTDNLRVNHERQGINGSLEPIHVYEGRRR
jgi:hypothetical protein